MSQVQLQAILQELSDKVEAFGNRTKRLEAKWNKLLGERKRGYPTANDMLNQANLMPEEILSRMDSLDLRMARLEKVESQLVQDEHVAVQRLQELLLFPPTSGLERALTITEDQRESNAAQMRLRQDTEKRQENRMQSVEVLETRLCNHTKFVEGELARLSGRLTELGQGQVAKIEQEQPLGKNEGLNDQHTVKVACMTESIWSSLFFIGFPSLGFGGSMMALWALAVNCIIQLVFVLIVLNSFTEDPFPRELIDALIEWRRTEGHDFSYSSSGVPKSLATRVCSATGGAGLSVATQQSTIVSSIRDYLPQTSSILFLAGPHMCIVALICWFGSVFQEIQEVVQLGRALYIMPSSAGSKYTWIDNELVVESISLSRQLSITWMLLFRIFIVVALAYSGTQYVVYTVSVRELLLNCVSLAFVMDVDESLFVAFAPRTLVHLIEATKPFAMRPLQTCSGVDISSIGANVLGTVGVIATYFLLLVPFVDRMEETERAICHGFKDFVYTFGPTGQVYWSPTATDTVLSAYYNYPDLALQEILDETSRSGRSAGTTNSDNAYSVHRIGSVAIQRPRDAFRDCTTEKLGNEPLLVEIFQTDLAKYLADGTPSWDFLAAGGLQAQDVLSIDRCEGFGWLCKSNAAIGVRMRMICPVVCGCGDHDRFVVDRSSDAGCDNTCAGRMQKLTKLTRNCTDKGIDEFTSLPFVIELHDYVQRLSGMVASSRNMDVPYYEYLQNVDQELQTEGCAAVVKWVAQLDLPDSYSNICDTPVFAYFLHAHCPEACGCTRTLGGEAGYASCPLCWTQILSDWLQSQDYWNQTFFDWLKSQGYFSSLNPVTSGEISPLHDASGNYTDRLKTGGVALGLNRVRDSVSSPATTTSRVNQMTLPVIVTETTTTKEVEVNTTSIPAADAQKFESEDQIEISHGNSTETSTTSHPVATGA